MKDDVIHIESQLNSLHMTYDPRDWEAILPNVAQDIKTPDVQIPSTAKFPWLEIQAITELNDASLVVRLPDVQDVCCSVANVSLTLERLSEDPRQWNTKLMMGSLRCSLTDSEPGIPALSHHWGNPLSIGVLVATTRPNAVGIVLDTLRSEWSLELARFLQQGFTYLKEHKRVSAVTDTPKDVNKTKTETLQLNLKVGNCNLFLIAENELSVMLRIDSATLEHSAKRFVAVSEGVCAITLNKNEPISCNEAKSLNHPFVAIRKCKSAITSEHVDVSLEGTHFAWSPNLHLRLLQLWRESADFRQETFGQRDKGTNFLEEPKTKKCFDLFVTGGIALTIDISPRHFLELSSDKLRLVNGEWSLNFVRIALDMVEIITIEGFELVKVSESKEVRIERQNNEGFELDWNETWACNIESAKACFPYEHQFTEAIQNELLSIRKWLKEIHSSGLPKICKPLPSDLVVKVRCSRFTFLLLRFSCSIFNNFTNLENSNN